MKHRNFNSTDLMQAVLGCCIVLVGYYAYKVNVKYEFLLAEASPVPVGPSYHYTTAEVTAYCICEICCGPWAEKGYKDDVRVTASGAPAVGFLVAAPKNVPFGTLLSIPGYAGGGWVPVEDRGGAIKGNCIDVLMKSHSDALTWGRQVVTIKVMDDN